MNTAQTQCPGCKKTFTPSGYSQHVSKTQRAVCRAVHVPGPSHFRTGPAAASQPLVNSGLSQGLPNALFAATRNPADHGMHEIGHDADPDFSAPSQAWMNGIVYSLTL